MAVVLRFVDRYGCIIERILAIIHVPETSALTLKAAIDQLFSKHGLSISHVRGQGYDGASNMSGKFNGLKSLILSENSCAFYIHCFAHQLQLTLVAVAKKHKSLCSFFDYLGLLANVVGASCKRKEILRLKQFQKVAKRVASGEIKSGRGLNQETILKRPGETRWSSQFKTILSVITLFSLIMDVLEFIADDVEWEKSTEASTLLKFMHDFEFVFLLHLLKGVMEITNDLSQALQRKDQDIVNAIALVIVIKQRLQCMRENWDGLLTETCEFCALHSIVVPKMEDIFVIQGRPQRNVEEITNLHRFRVQLFFTMIDSQLGELNDCFDNTNTELLSGMACLDPRDSFSAFDKKKLIEFAKFYPSEFDDMELLALDGQLQNYIVDMRNDPNFSSIKGIGELAQMLVKKKKDNVYPQVYLLLKLALLLPVATTTVKRTFSAMNIVKNELRNQMRDEWMNDCLVTYIEHNIFATIENETIMQKFQAMKPRKMLL